MRSSNHDSFIAVFWTAALGVAMAAGCAAGCRACDKDDRPSATAEAEPESTMRDQLLHRIAGHDIDLTKSYPKRADGLVDCGTDRACFVAMAERCAPALVDYDVRVKGMMMTKHQRALYRIAGKEGDACKVQRQVLVADMELSDEARKGLLKSGRTENEIAAMRTEGLLLLQASSPERASCSFDETRMLEVALGIYEDRHVDGHFQEPCQAPAAGDEWPADLTPPAAK